MTHFFAVLDPLQVGVIVIIGLFFTGIAFFLIFRESKAIKASDGTRFSSEASCIAYEAVLEKIQPLFQEDEIDRDIILNLGEYLTTDP